MQLNRVSTFTATIFVGLREQADGPTHTHAEVVAWLRQHCDEAGLCVTLTPTTFIYRKGHEDGVIIGLINYPRFPSSEEGLVKHAITIAQGLLVLLHQSRVSVVFPDYTVMLEGAGL